jgi:hypothetical protein
MMRRSAKWLLLPLALLSAGAVAMPQLLFLGYDLRDLLDQGGVQPLSPPADGLPYALADGPEWLAIGGSLYPARDDLKLGYQIEDLVLSDTPAVARKL